MTDAPNTEKAGPRRASTATGGWRPVAGFTRELFFIAVAWGVAFASLPAVIFLMMRGVSPSSLFWTAFWSYFFITFKVTAWLSDKYRARQRKTLMSAQDLLSRDARPHVLYLRSFKDDEITSRLLNLSTEEQELAVVMLEIGPFIAFGEPGEESPDPGAARLYVKEARWRDEVKNLISGARLVVARMGNTESFWWEMATAVHLLSPERLLLLLPESKNEYEECRRRANGVFPCRLPDHQFRSPRSTLSKSHISSEGFLYFGPGWTPHLERFKPAYLRQNYGVPGVPIFKMALRPVYERLGVDWRRPPLQVLQVLPLIMLLIFLLFALYVMALLLIELSQLIRAHI